MHLSAPFYTEVGLVTDWPVLGGFLASDSAKDGADDTLPDQHAVKTAAGTVLSRQEHHSQPASAGTLSGYLNTSLLTVFLLGQEGKLQWLHFGFMPSRGAATPTLVSQWLLHMFCFNAKNLPKTGHMLPMVSCLFG